MSVLTEEIDAMLRDLNDRVNQSIKNLKNPNVSEEVCTIDWANTQGYCDCVTGLQDCMTEDQLETLEAIKRDMAANF